MLGFTTIGGSTLGGINTAAAKIAYIGLKRVIMGTARVNQPRSFNVKTGVRA